VRRSAVALALVAAVLAGCGEKEEPPASRVTAVTATVDLERPAPAPPDAGTTAGHRAPATASTTRSAFAFSGHVEPPASKVTLRPAGTVAVGDDGSFRARAGKLKRGANRFVLEARSAGLTPWKLDIAITRK
jgi:predicted small lipoprotein YifL